MKHAFIWPYMEYRIPRKWIQQNSVGHLFIKMTYFSKCGEFFMLFFVTRRVRDIWVWQQFKVCMCMVAIDIKDRRYTCELKIPMHCGPFTPQKIGFFNSFFHSLPSLSVIFLTCDHLLYYNPMIQCLLVPPNLRLH